MNESASLTVLHFPGSSAMTADYFITVRAGSESESLELTVVSRDNTRAFESRINDAMLQKIKHQCGCEHDSDEEWFRDVSTAINHNEVTVVTLIPALEVHHPRRGAVMFPLEPLVPCQGFSGYNVILDTLLKSIRVRLKPREVQRQLEELCTRESEVQQSVAEAEKELSGLQDQIAQTREIELVNQRRIEQLEQEIARIEEEQRSAGIQTVAFDEEDDVHRCRVRVPIIGERKDLDGDLLRMVKSKYLTSEDKSLKDQEVKYCTLYMPMTTSELEAATGVLSTGQKRAVWECLTKIDEWDFDVFSLQKLMSGDDHDSLAWQTQGGSLLITTYALFLRYGCFQKFNLDERLVLNWLSVVEGGYNPNPYHNSMHAADVVHITHYILSAGKLIATCKLSDEDIFASLFAAAIHDYNHPGINNNFHIKASTYLATLYNDRSILENFHVSSVFELMKLPRFNVLSCFSDEQRRDIRDTVVEMVLATDMGLHAKILGQFRRRLQENHDLSKKDDVRLALSMAVKTADISNCGRPEKLYLKWCAKIADEFYMQGDRERTSGMPCSPFMDRYQPAMAKGQIAFINYIVIPLFESISELLPEMHFTVDFAENNKNYWMNHDDSVK